MNRNHGRYPPSPLRCEFLGPAFNACVPATPEADTALLRYRQRRSPLSPIGNILPPMEEDVLVMDGVLVESENSSGGQRNNGSGMRRNKSADDITCRSWDESGLCRFGSKCQFAHGKEQVHDFRVWKNKGEEVLPWQTGKHSPRSAGSLKSSGGSKLSRYSSSPDTTTSPASYGKGIVTVASSPDMSTSPSSYGKTTTSPASYGKAIVTVASSPDMSTSPSSYGESAIPISSSPDTTSSPSSWGRSTITVVSSADVSTSPSSYGKSAVTVSSSPGTISSPSSRSTITFASSADVSTSPSSYAKATITVESSQPSLKTSSFNWPPTEEEEEIIARILYGPTSRPRLPVFEKICPS